MQVSPIAAVAPTSPTSQTSTSASSRSGRPELRGMSYDEQVAALAPVQMKGAPGAVEGGDQGGPKISKGAAKKRLDEILDPSNTPLSDDVVGEARSLVDRLGDKKQAEYGGALDARVASGEAEARLGALLDHLDAPITAAATAEAEGLIEKVADNRRAPWAAKLTECVAWGAAATEVAEIVEGASKPLGDADVARAEALIASLPAEQQAKWKKALALRVENDPIEAQLEAGLSAGGMLTQERVDALKALIGTLTNGRGAAWQKRLDDRVAADAAQVFEGDEKTRSTALSTMSAEQVTERAGDKKTRRGKYKGDQLTRVEFDKEHEVSVSTLKGLKTGDYAANVEALVAEKSEHMNLSQKALIAKAKEFLSKEPKPSGARAAFAELDVPANMAASPDLSLDGDLIARMKRFTRFAAWAGLIGAKPKVNDGVRSPANAHKLSTRYMFTSGIGLGGSGNRKVVADWAIAHNGKADDQQWIPTDLVAELKAANGDDAVYKTVLIDKVKTRITQQVDQAAEGYPEGEKRMPNVRPTGISLHCSGQAMDVSYAWVFSNSYDPMIDLLAAYFGLWRPVKDSKSSPEYWHYEKLGSVVASDATAD